MTSGMTDSDALLGDLAKLSDMIALTLEIEPGAPNTYRRLQRLRHGAEPGQFGARYRIETFPARYARVMRQPRNRLYGLEESETAKVRQLLSGGTDIGKLIDSASDMEHDEYRELDLDLQATAGTSLPEVAGRFLPLLDQLAATQPPPASELPYSPEEFRRTFAHLLTLADSFIRARADGLSEAQATAGVTDTLADRRPGQPGPVLATADGIAKIRMLLATSRAEDGSELGLAHPAGPGEGWLTWYRRILDRVEDMVRGYNATLNPATQMVTVPAGAPPPDPPGLASPQYHYAARFAAAYEGAPITDSEQGPSPESLRFDRAHTAIGLLLTDAYELLYRQTRLLLTDAESDSGLLERILGPTPAGQGLDMGAALAAAMRWYTPRPLWQMPGRPAWAPGAPDNLESLGVLPMNRWEVRFRFPELLDLCSHLPAGSGAAGLETAVGSFTAAREPARVRLPPVVGELHEIVHLLPFDHDLGSAMTHLGADGSDGAAWRTALLQAAGAITARIWHHEDNL